jgi:hypothetical protein
MSQEINLVLRNWRYRIRQDEQSGELTVVASERVGLVEKAVQYAKAEASMMANGRLPLEVIDQRREACDGCEGVDKRADGEWYCDRCGCPKWKRSQLQVKWEMPAATCPLGKWPK